jgi:hypothetical protein
MDGRMVLKPGLRDRLAQSKKVTKLLEIQTCCTIVLQVERYQISKLGF